MRNSSVRRLAALTGIWLWLLASIAGAALADGPTLTVQPEKLVFQGMVESDPIEVESVLWVTLEGWEEGQQGPTLHLELKSPTSASEKDEVLKAEMEAGRTFLPLTRLSFEPAEPVLQNGRATAIKVKVQDVEWPGRYVGELTYSATVDEKASASLKKAAEDLKGKNVILELDIRTKPRLVAPEESISMRRVRCWWLGCDLAGLFLSDNPEAPAPWPVELRNDSLRPIIIAPRARIRRQGSPTAVAGIDLSATNAGAMEGVAIATTTAFELSVESSQLRPGKYEGDLQFTATPKLEEPLLSRGPKGGPLVRNRTDVTVPVTIDVRAGIVLPIVLVLLGIVAGRLNREISSTEAQARLKLYDQTVTLGDRIERLGNEDEKRKLQASLASVRRRIENVSVPESEIQQTLNELAEKIRLLEELEDRQAELLRQEELGAEAAALGKVQDQIERARGAVLAGKIAVAKESLAGLSDAIRKAAAGGSESDVEAVLAALSREGLEAVGDEAPAKPHFPGLVKFLAVLAGLRRVSVRAGYWYLQPLATLALLVALTVYGLYLFYAGDDNRTFGANGLVDYFPLFLWGFGSDVLTKRLQDISFTRS